MIKRDRNWQKTKVRRENTAVVVPFNPFSPVFLSNDFFSQIKHIEKLPYKYVIFPFYVKTIYSKKPSCLLVHNGKIANIFGEWFSNKNACFMFQGKTCQVLLYYDVFSLTFDKANADVFVALDDEELQNANYVYNKFDDKLQFFGPISDKKLIKLNFFPKKT